MLTQGQRDAIATAIARRDALLQEAAEFAARGIVWDAEARRAQANAYETQRMAIVAKYGES